MFRPVLLLVLAAFASPIFADDDIGTFCGTFAASGANLCPCVNGLGAPYGCPNTAHPQWGASLDANGHASVSNDSLHLIAAAMTPGSSILIVQSDHSTTYGTVFGDGLRCVTGSLVRIRQTQADPAGGFRNYPNLGETPISILGGIPPSGGYRAYQVWYRTVQSFCPNAAFNMTNAVGVYWQN